VRVERPHDKPHTHRLSLVARVSYVSTCTTTIFTLRLSRRGVGGGASRRPIRCQFVPLLGRRSTQKLAPKRHRARRRDDGALGDDGGASIESFLGFSRDDGARDGALL